MSKPDPSWLTGTHKKKKFLDRLCWDNSIVHIGALKKLPGHRLANFSICVNIDTFNCQRCESTL